MKERDRTRRWLVTATAASVAAAGTVRKPAAQDLPVGRLILRDPAPAPAGVRWSGLDGAARSLADYAGMGVVLNLWATWCAPCVAELPSLGVLAGRVASSRIAVVPLSSDSGGGAVVQRFYAEHGIAGLGIWLDPRASVVDAVGAIGLPTTVIIDRRGREVGRLLGPADWSAPGTAETVRALCNL